MRTAQTWASYSVLYRFGRLSIIVLATIQEPRTRTCCELALPGCVDPSASGKCSLWSTYLRFIKKTTAYMLANPSKGRAVEKVAKNLGFNMKCRRGLVMSILSVRLVLCQYVRQTRDCDKMKERSVQVFISYDRSFSLVF